LFLERRFESRLEYILEGVAGRIQRVEREMKKEAVMGSRSVGGPTYGMEHCNFSMLVAVFVTSGARDAIVCPWAWICWKKRLEKCSDWERCELCQ
jgi:hypothetical protein